MPSDPIFDQAQRQWEEPPDGGVDWLAWKPHGACPWCSGVLVNEFSDGKMRLCCQTEKCLEWEEIFSEEANRARYAREQQDADDAEERAFRNAIKFRWEEF